ncbi:hypothetical protein EPUS_07448 [Endocarpon pusillum Z07020]|uniref:Uncharacterized protein n=1 Tax=Endocarpon pusillum (strain Z07020 / HMAS-L-300199) TaxID=1263415 RepID=U1GIL0_ENDPU|nr:uncharacterized protein EPUS_07448 [Endocarpon pusillum Z07020]ERF71978.1 hypothetical protein EPUS_07448 [Endocarpon pusillum Z07020]
MVLSRSKRSNAGKAPQRLDEPALSTPAPPSTQLKRSKKAAQPAKRLVLSMKKPQAAQSSSSSSVISVSLHQEKAISLASESLEPLLSDDDGSIAQQEEQEDKKEQEEQEEAEEEEEEEEEVEEAEEKEISFQPYTIELSVVLGKKAIYNSFIKLTKLNFEHFKQDAY